MKSKGFTLIEVLIGMVIISLIAVGYLSALTASSKASMTTDQSDTARAIAQSQMEYVKEQSFSTNGNYNKDTTILSEYPGYDVLPIVGIPAAERDSLIQKITITVTYNGQTITTLEDCKTR